MKIVPKSWFKNVLNTEEIDLQKQSVFVSGLSWS
jgi:hypothetical protein